MSLYSASFQTLDIGVNPNNYVKCDPFFRVDRLVVTVTDVDLMFLTID